MFKKRLMFCMLLSSTLFLVGCNSVKDLTDEETRLIAEYAGDLLLKYDLNYTDRVDEGNKAADAMAEASTEELSAEVATEEQEATEENTTEMGKDVSGRIEQDTSEDSEATVGTLQDIAQIAGVDGVSITYSNYIITSQYPEGDGESDFINLEASEGYELLVVRFNVTNVSEDIVNVSLMDKGLDYRIVCNGSKAANPMLTILMNDLGTLDTSVNPGETQEAVLIFQISEDMKNQLESIKLYVNYNDLDNIIDIS